MSVESAATYFWGECTRFVADQLPWIPGGLGDAKQWLGNAQAAGLATGATPLPGAAAVWGAGTSSIYGHVAVVDKVNADGSFQVSEQNYTNGLGKTDTRTVTSLDNVLGFIYPPGSAAPPVTGLGGLHAPDPGTLFSGLEGAVTRAGYVVGAVALLGFGLFLLVVSSGGLKSAVNVTPAGRAAGATK